MPIRFLVIILLMSSFVFGATVSHFQKQVDSINKYLKSGLPLPELGYVDVEIKWLEKTLGDPKFRYDFARNKIVLSLHQNHVQNSESLVYLLVHLAGILEYPILYAEKFRDSDKPTPEIISLLKRWKVDYSMNFFSFLELNAEPSDTNMQMRKRIFYLAAITHFLDKAKSGGSNSNEIFTDVFPGEQWDMKKFEDNADKAIKAYEKIYKISGWGKLQSFNNSLGSLEFRKLVEKNERSKVADYLELRLPLAHLSKNEILFWKAQLEAIRRPRADNKVSLFRGGPFKSKGFLSTSLTAESQRDSIARRPWIIDNLIYSSSRLNNLYRHNLTTSLHYISTTTDGEIAAQFAERSQTLSYLEIDARRVLPAFLASWNESEYLVPLVIFPDEIVASTQNQSINKLISRFRMRVEKSEKKIKENIDLKRYLNIEETIKVSSCVQLYQ